MGTREKKQELWQAATDGDLGTVRSLCGDASVDVNWVDEERGRSVFYRAVQFGHQAVVEYLMGDPRVNVTQQHKEGHTPFCKACGEGHLGLVLLLMADPRVDVNLPQNEGGSPFLFACQEGRTRIVQLLLNDPRVDVTLSLRDGTTPYCVASHRGHAQVIALLLDDPRIEVNRGMADGTSPLWFSSQNGHLAVVQLVLASHRDMDTRLRSNWNKKTAAEHARWAALQPTWDSPHDSVERRSLNCPPIALLLDKYEVDPPSVRDRLRLLPVIRGTAPPPSPSPPPTPPSHFFSFG